MTAPLFPYAPLDVAAELFLNGWQDVTSDVYHRDKIRVTRGRQNEQGTPSPSSCELTLDNRSGKYSPRNPLSPYYPLLGRNTPLRVGVRVAKDAFGRSVASGWGTADVGGAWSTAGTGGSVLASQWNVGSGVGTIVVPVASAHRLSYQAAQLYRDVDVAVTASVPFSDVTGAALGFTVAVSGLSATDYFRVNAKVQTNESVTMSIVHYDGTIVVADTTVTGLTHTGQQLRIRAQVDGQTIRGKVWAASGAEPYGWNVEGRSDLLAGRAAGWAGVRAGTDSGNTNVPVTFSFDNFEVRVNRFAGEIASFPPQWDTSGNDVYTQIEGAGVRRRLSQGDSPLKSTYLRGNQTITPPHIAYWPVEDLADSTQIASGIGGQPMYLVGGKTTFATNSDFPGSAPIASTNACRWVGTVPRNAATGQIQLIFLLSIPSGGEVDQATLAQIQTNGTAAFIDCFYQVGGSLVLRFYDPARAAIATSAVFFPGVGFNGAPYFVSLQFTQNGGNVDYAFASLAPGAVGGNTLAGTLAGNTIGSVTGLFINAYRQATSSAIGHVAVRSSITSIFTLANQLKAYAGESASSRIIRLCNENSIANTYSSDGAVGSAALGIQGRSNLMALLDEASNADIGSLYESRSVLGLWRRGRSSLYNQAPVLTLDYDAGHLVPPFRPIEDDANLRNDVTVTRSGGSSYEAVQTTGRLAVTAPSVGTGVGEYDTAVTLNLYTDDQIQDAAGWLLNLGTVDEARYPQITVNVAKLATINTQLALDAMAVNLDDRITISNPKTLIAPDQISQLARGYTETLGGKEWEITYNCAPESPYEVTVLDSATKGKIDTETCVLAADATSAATTLSVSDSQSTWTSDPAEMPIPVTVGGETMNITAATSEALSNTSFEAGTSPWTSFGVSSFTQSATQKHSGSFAGRIVPDGVTANIGVSSEKIPVAADALLTVSTWAWFTNTVTGNFCVGVTWLDAANATISVSTSFVSVAATTWTQVRRMYAAPAGSANALLTVFLQGTPAAGQIWYLDDVSVVGPQRLTVTRSLNGIVKAQTAGTKVSLTRRAVIAL